MPRSCKVRDGVPRWYQVRDGVPEVTRGQAVRVKVVRGQGRSAQVVQGQGPSARGRTQPGTECQRSHEVKQGGQRSVRSGTECRGRAKVSGTECQRSHEVKQGGQRSYKVKDGVPEVTRSNREERSRGR